MGLIFTPFDSKAQRYGVISDRVWFLFFYWRLISTRRLIFYPDDGTQITSETVFCPEYQKPIKPKLKHTSRLKKSNKMQQYADIYLLLNYCTCFGRPSRPSSGIHKTVVAACGTDHTIWGASFLRRDQIRTRLRKLPPQIV